MVTIIIMMHCTLKIAKRVDLQCFHHTHKISILNNTLVGFNRLTTYTFIKTSNCTMKRGKWGAQERIGLRIEMKGYRKIIVNWETLRVRKRESQLLLNPKRYKVKMKIDFEQKCDEDFWVKQKD